jgi:hypothetical protein
MSSFSLLRKVDACRMMSDQYINGIPKGYMKIMANAYGCMAMYFRLSQFTL